MPRNGNKLSMQVRQEQRMTEQQRQAIGVALEKALRHLCGNVGPARSDPRTHDFVFHMTDWYDDLLRLARLYEDPSAHTQAEWNDAVLGFLYHVPGHLNAAAKLSNTLLDPFKALSAKSTRKPRRTRTTTTGKRVAAS